MAQTQIASQQRARFELHSERLGPLPLINHFIVRMGLEALLDKHVPTTDGRCSMPHAKALGVLLRSIIVEREPIYRQQETVHGFAPGSFGLSAEEMHYLGDDRIGRALDRLFNADRAALLTEVVVAVGKRFAVRFDQLHNDSTSISFCGQYSEASRRSIRGRTAPAITYGFSKDHRPDLKQLLFILTTDAEGGAPSSFVVQTATPTTPRPTSTPGTRCAPWPVGRTSSMWRTRSCAAVTTWSTSTAPAVASSP